jgi:multidrug efflux system membrane fusion protein
MRIAGKKITNVGLTVVLVVLLGVWMLSGFIFPSGGSNAKAPDPKELSMDTRFAVRVMDSLASEHTREVVFYGVTEADRVVSMTADVDGKVERLLIKEGQQVKKGQKLIKLEVRDRGAKLSQAKALVEQRQIDYDAALRLSEKGLASNKMLAERRSMLEQAKAEVIQTKLALQRSSVIAPFDGVIESIDVEEGELINSRDKTIVTIVDRHPLAVRGHVTEFDIAWLKEGQQAEVLLADGRQFGGDVIFVGVLGDDMTRTFRVEANIPNESGEVPAGVTATVRIVVGTVQAHLIPSSVMELNPVGEIGVKAVNESNEVTFHPLEIVKETAEGMIVAGLPERLRVVTLGGPFVNVGETVAVSSQPAPTDKQ